MSDRTKERIGALKRKAFRRLPLPFAILAAAWLLAACEQKNTYVEPPPPKVTTARPLQQEVIDYLEFTGNTQAIERVEVRARVAGFLESMHFTPGTMVEKGDLLFVIDPREYQARLNAAQAEYDAARAHLRRAEAEFARAKNLFEQQAGSEKNVVQWRGERDIARAAVALAKAKFEQANLDLSYTQVTAPIAGRISRERVDVGNLVGEGEPTLLTTVTQYDPMYAYFNLNERDLLKVMDLYRKQVEEKGFDPYTEPDTKAELPLFLGLANEEGYPQRGILDFAESGVDSGTGTMQIRGVFPNPGKVKVLLPGLFARIRMPVKKRENALLVTERAIGSDQSGRYLLVANKEDVVEKRPIRMGRLVDGLRVIEEGLRFGEWVIVSGLQRARPGAKVDPDRTSMSSLTASAMRAAAQGGRDKASPPGAGHEDKAGTDEHSAKDAAGPATPPEGGDSESAPQPESHSQ